MKRTLFTAIILFALLALSGCNLFQAVTEPTLDPNEIQTLAAGTVQARQTLSSLETKVAALTRGFHFFHFLYQRRHNIK